MPIWVNHKLESRLPGEISTTSGTDDTSLMAKSEEELKSLLMRVKEESEKTDLKLNIKKLRIMASGPNTSWQRQGEKLEAVADFTFFGCENTENGDSSCFSVVQPCPTL